MRDPEEFNRHRPLLFSLAYRMLGSVMDAEDIVQDTFLRWQRCDGTEARSPKSYLAAIATRLCIDHLRSARVRREWYVGSWLPEPLFAETSMDESLADSLSTAFLVLLESLTPAERAVYLLRDVFDYDYAEIAQIVERSEVSCRQLAKRARDHVSERKSRFTVSQKEVRQVLDEFRRACVTGDVAALLGLLEASAVAWSDGGGKVASARLPIRGAPKIARFLAGLARKVPSGFASQVVRVNGGPGIVSYIGGRPHSVLTLEVVGGKIRSVFFVLNPDKLLRVPPAEAPSEGPS